MARRSKGEGAIYLRGDGRWEAQLRLGAGRRRSVYGRTKREVLGKLREARWALKRGLPVSSRKLTLGELLERWLEMIKSRVGPAPTKATSSTQGAWVLNWATSRCRA